MAAKSTIAKRYAKALVDTFADLPRASAALVEIESIVHSFLHDKKLGSFLKSPAFSREEKWDVLSQIFSNANASKEITQFMRVLLDADRVSLLEEVFVQYKRVLMERLGEAEALVESAYALTESEQSLIQANLEKTIGKKLRLKVFVNPELVAGLKVNVDGKTFDGTLTAHLDRLQKQLSQAEA